MESSMPHAGNDAVDIVRVVAEHLDQVAPLFDAYRRFYRMPSDIEAGRAFLAERLARDESVIFLALQRAGQRAGDAARPVGFTQLYPFFSSVALRRAWVLNDLFVAPEARGHGVARALLERARAFAVETAAAELSLQTARDNVSAQALYERLGWRRDDEFLTYVLTV